MFPRIVLYMRLVDVESLCTNDVKINERVRRTRFHLIDSFENEKYI